MSRIVSGKCARKWQNAHVRDALNIVLDHVGRLLRDSIERAAQVSRNLQRQHTRIHDSYIRRSIHSQPSIHHTSQAPFHHRTCPNRVADGVELVPDPALPVRGRAAVGIVRHALEAGDCFARAETRQGSLAEETANEPGRGDLVVHVEIDAEWVDVDLRLREGVGGCDLNGSTTEREEIPHIDTDRIRVSGVIEQLDNGRCPESDSGREYDESRRTVLVDDEVCLNLEDGLEREREREGLYLATG